MTVIGTIELVLRAKRDGHIEAARPVLDALQGSEPEDLRGTLPSRLA